MRTLLVLLMLCFTAVSHAVSTAENQRIYVNSDFKRAEVFPSNSRGLPILKDIVVADVLNKKVSFIVRKKGFNPKKIIVVQKSLFSKKIERLQTKVISLSDLDAYRVTVTLKDDDLPLVVFRVGSFLSGSDYFVAINDLQQAGVAELQNNKRLPARNQLKYVETLLLSYPSNFTLHRMQTDLSIVVDRLDDAARTRKRTYADKMAFKAALALEKNTTNRYEWKEGYQRYLKLYPNGKYVNKAKESLRRIQLGLQTERNTTNPQSEGDQSISLLSLFSIG
ncbi:hypothetical protein A9Q99_23515 [Gammaproteobacteria bacterium 45_16_T64]|nr:hypothetical protein A9Q99_23515 [Gammaproteobacteria bacterium 45_16_T64]